jgi:hypothetical protein
MAMVCSPFPNEKHEGARMGLQVVGVLPDGMVGAWRARLLIRVNGSRGHRCAVAVQPAEMHAMATRA